MYITGLNCAYMNQMGGLDYYKQLAKQRAGLLWEVVDASNGFYKSKITDHPYRSNMNVIFRIRGGNKDMEELFIAEAKKVGIVQIRGHTFNPGVRISMYNAMPLVGVEFLCDFMRKFQARNSGIAKM